MLAGFFEENVGL